MRVQRKRQRRPATAVGDDAGDERRHDGDDDRDRRRPDHDDGAGHDEHAGAEYDERADHDEHAGADHDQHGADDIDGNHTNDVVDDERAKQPELDHERLDHDGSAATGGPVPAADDHHHRSERRHRSDNR